MTERKRAETIELSNDPSLTLDIFKTAKKLEYLLDYTPQYAKTLKAVRKLTATDIEVTDEQQKRYVDVERVFRDIMRKIREKEKEEEKDLPVIGLMENHTSKEDEG